MRIALPSTGKDLNSIVDSRFGRALYFVFVDVEGKEIKKFEAYENPAYNAFGGAGIQASQFVANKGANVVISPSIGPNSFGLLIQVGIKIYSCPFGISIKQAVEMFLEGKLNEFKAPFGPGFGRGRGWRGGWGRGPW
ncbi:MAG: dinitrogenase iron-molybdenum cofactor [Candidatus Aenigmarchaeota archaeon ex4484_224]|nr:MAG: dinitrogenase iron-molybdenum cofactor [Candidatus Aenigmarchaeota archaeon ex4484_224]